MKFTSKGKQLRSAKLEVLPYILGGSLVMVSLVLGTVYIRDEYGNTSFGEAATNMLGSYENNSPKTMRVLIVEDNPLCDGLEDYGGGAAVLLPIVLILWVFVGLAVICDEYFQTSLEKISEALSLSPDVAGATFLAAGSSAPELFTSAADAFGDSSSIGMGTIVGSAMFNILVIVAASAAVAGKGGASLDIDYRPVTRDIIFYLTSIILLAVFFMDGKVVMYEALIMFLTYVLYIFFMSKNKKILAMLPPPEGDIQVIPTEGDVEMQEKTDKATIAEIYDDIKEFAMPEDDNAEGNKSEVKEPESFWARFEVPEDPKAWPLYGLTTVFRIGFAITVPDCNIEFFQNWYWLTFAMCIVWIGVLCHYMVLWATEAACILKISPIVMGVLVLAVGTSVPDAIGSMIAARNGEADMAIANAIGSNVFDILVGLGLPWFAVTVINKVDVPVCADGIMTSVIILFCTAILFVGVLKFNKWKMNNKIGNRLLFLYLLYVIYTILGAAFIKKGKC